MDWVEGEPLSKFVGSRLNEPDTLRRIAAQWRGGTTASLRGLRIAHNDLQHGNVMVQGDGNIRLVDYDAMFLPKVSRRNAARNRDTRTTSTPSGRQSTMTTISTTSLPW